MDAKAKVVAFRPVVRKDGNATCGYTAHMTSKPDNRDSDWRGEESRQWVRLTDHEAALAELRAERDAWQKSSQTWQGIAQRRTSELDALRSGLEALAGEWEMLAAQFYKQNTDISNVEAASMKNDAKQLRQLIASSATGEKNTEEEMK